MKPSTRCRRTSTPNLVTYNTKRPHQGRGMNGRTPARVFKDGLPNREKPKKMENAKAA